MDIDASLAHTVAKRTGATPTTSLEDVLTDTSVDVVAVTSPNAFHANQVIAACTAGKRAILCEKPLAVTAGEARRIAAASATSGTPVVVGTMHAFDPAVVAALDAWAELGEPASFVHSSIYLPRNRSFASAATFIELPPDAEGHGGNTGGRTTHEMFGDVILGLAIHAVPLVRQLFPEFDDVAVGQYLRPVGYFLTARSGPRTAQMMGLMPTQWRPDWKLRALSDRHELSISFPPSYVLAGSAMAELSSPTAARRWSFAENGYQAEWLEIERLVRAGSAPRFAIDEAVDDLDFALRLVEGSTREREPV
jgi:myo-inositol 2-dehydrogenase / D-chiro-inositol 1-dehydrogenase